MSSQDLSPALRRRDRGARTACRIIAAVAMVTLLASACTPEEQPQAPAQRVLQSVGVGMLPDGTITTLDDNVISVRDDAGDATAETHEYSPNDVVDGLPVRVTTSYRTADGTGTDLRNLAGYTGRVEIDLTVENLTLRPQSLTYDVGGTSRERAALVGAPLTVVGSTALSGTSATEVVTAGPDGGAVTNGVLSQSEDGYAVVQWAAVLAPPQLPANTTLTLVADTVDFQVPVINLSVQPGVVTDPSVSGVLDAAFNDGPGSQLALERQTIETLADVNDVLTRASLDISEVRKNLDTTSEDLGTRTVEELETSTEGVTQSMEMLDEQLDGLNVSIAESLKSTQSSVLQELASTVSAVDAALGDPGAGGPSVTVDGEGCEMTVASPGAADSVAGSLQQVTGQLSGYASATEACKEASAAALAKSIGPEDPSEETCSEPSLTCTLYSTETEIDRILDDLVADGEELIDSLQPVQITDTSQEFDAVSTDVDRVTETAGSLAELDHSDLRARLEEAESAIASIDDGQEPTDDSKDLVDLVVEQLDLIHSEAELARSEIGVGQTEPTAPASTAPSAAPTATTDASATITATPEPSATVTAVPEPSATITAAPEPSATVTAVPEPTATVTATPEPSPSFSPEPSVPPSPTPSQDFIPGSMLDQNQTVAEELCPLADDGGFLDPGTGVDREQIDRLRSYLVNTGCTWTDSDGEPEDPAEFDGPLDPAFDASMQDRLLAQAADWQSVMDRTDTGDDTQVLSRQLAEVRLAAGMTKERIEAARTALDSGDSALTERLAELDASIQDLRHDRTELGVTLEQLAEDQEQWKREHDEFAPKIRTAFADAADRTGQQVSEVIDPKIREVSTQAQVDSEAVGEMFDKSAAGLSNAAEQISANGTKVVQDQRDQLGTAQSRADSASSELIDSALDSMAESVSGSTQDMNAASTQLTDSLRRVLRDIGTREVRGSGLLGAMTTSASRVGTADVQLALASGTAVSYSNVRSEEVDAILMRQEQLRAALEADAQLPPFQIEVPAGTETTTIYNFRIGVA